MSEAESPVRKKDIADDPARPPGWRVEGVDERKDPDKAAGGRAPMARRWVFTLVIGLLLLNWLVASRLVDNEQRLRIPYSTFFEQLEAGNVADFTSRGDTIQGTFREEFTFEDETNILFDSERPTFAADDDIVTIARQNDTVINARPIDSPTPFWQVLLYSFGPTLLFIGILLYAFRRMAGGAGGLGGLGRSRARRYDDGAKRVTFEDVAGIDEAEGELVELVDFLKNPSKYAKLGGAIPKGVLLSGPPGTGKTLLARAVAGEAGVPFFSSSASEFIEMVVGVGASRVRDLFDQAKKLAPAIIFIDELDAIGRARGGGASFGGHDEREQTLNQILTEMDGFVGNEGVIVLAATNRPEILDAALLRPGRFDRQVVVSPPDQHGRESILRIHTRGVPLDDDVDLKALASTTPGMVGADLRNLVNEGALTAARRGHERVRMADLTDSLEKILLGVERNIVISPEERERTAYHESGHALLGMLQPGADPVRKISIIPRGRALGVTLQTPEQDRYSADAEYLRGRIIGLLGGRAAEEVVYGNVTTGAESDLEQTTRLARMMVGRWGMSEKVGLVTVLPAPGHESPFGMDPNAASATTMQLVDQEVRRIVDECYAAAISLLNEERSRLNALAAALLDRETLDELDAYAVAGVERISKLPPAGTSTLSPAAT
jgi:cell division protease FtsH